MLTHLWWQMLPSYIRHSSMSSTSPGPSAAFSPCRSSPMEKASLGYGLSDTEHRHYSINDVCSRPLDGIWEIHMQRGEMQQKKDTIR